MRKALLSIIAITLLYLVVDKNPQLFRQFSEPTSSAETVLEKAYANRLSDLQVQGTGIVSRILRDDREGSRHQKFILRLHSGQNILIVHNIDLAQRINSLSVGDKIDFFGEYEWNPKGGLIHWTHHDPANRHIDGWLKHEGNLYQ